MSRSPPPPLVAAGHSLLLDFDGTLVELADRPDAITIDAPLIALLRRLTATFDGRLAIVSGRSVAQIEAFLGSAAPTIIGSHGAELKRDDRRIAPDRPPALLAAERDLTAAFGTRRDVVIEIKSHGVALHYRLVPPHEAAAIERHARDIARRFDGHDGLVLQEGKLMVELRTGGHDKGSGIAALLGHGPFAGHIPVFAGDDVTDEPGFATVAHHDGIGVLVGPDRPTAARHRLADVAAVRRWLEDAA